MITSKKEYHHDLETEEERQLRLQLLDGKKTVTAILNLRSLVKTNQDKRRLSKEAGKLAKEVVQDYRSKNLRWSDWQRKRKSEQGRA